MYGNFGVRFHFQGMRNVEAEEELDVDELIIQVIVRGTECIHKTGYV